MDRSGVRALVALVVAAAFFALPSAASAGQVVFDRGTELWVMQDNGSNQQVFLRAADVPGMIDVTSPSADPAGASTLTFTALWAGGEAERKKWSPDGPAGACGIHCDGLYRWNRGVVSRISAAPAACPLNPCADLHDDSALARDGRVAYERGFFNFGTTGCGSWCVTDSSTQLLVRPSGGGNASPLGGRCDDAADPAANPANAGQFAHVGCQSGAGNTQLDVIGAGGPYTISFDDGNTSEPAFSRNGGEVAAVESGGDPGLWVYPNAANRNGRRALADPTSHTFSSPAYTGDGRILFVANRDVWSIPASCNECSFPGSATRLTSRGDINSITWSPAARFEVPRGGPVPGPGPGGNPGPGPGDTTAPRMGLRTKSASVSAGGALSLRVACPAAENSCRGTIRLRAKVGRRTRTIGKGRFSIAGGGVSKVKVKLNRAGRSLLKRKRKLKVGVVVRATDAAGNARTTRGKLTLKRPKRR